jgi:putative phosphoribosyl transferase
MTPEPFYAVEEHYDDFTQTSDGGTTLLDEAQLWHRENAS